jgi:type IV secretory pathway VirB6-like protein
MKETLVLKQIDRWLQFAALLLPLCRPLYQFVTDIDTAPVIILDGLGKGILLSYGWQLLSHFLNARLLNVRYSSSDRSRFGRLSFRLMLPALLIGRLLFLFAPGGIWCYRVALWFACFMMLWYFIISSDEIVSIRRFIKRKEYR